MYNFFYFSLLRFKILPVPSVKYSFLRFSRKFRNFSLLSLTCEKSASRRRAWAADNSSKRCRYLYFTKTVSAIISDTFNQLLYVFQRTGVFLPVLRLHCLFPSIIFTCLFIFLLLSVDIVVVVLVSLSWLYNGQLCC
jgi:hypothetical protein